MTNWDYSGGYDGPHPDQGDWRDESVADTPDVERYDAANEARRVDDLAVSMIVRSLLAATDGTA